MKSLHLNLVIIIFLFIVTIYLLFKRCTCIENDKNTKENMSNLNPSPIGYSISDGVPGDKWDQHKTEFSNSHHSYDFYKGLSDIKAGKIPLPKDELYLFYENQFDPKCCFQPQQYSSSTGCACISEVQMKFLNERGGNNNMD